ncbi:6-hydroxynicotinate 3-monooxygenase precursor [Legionella rubrilucens]|uniref:6-hydroxynicotinate 3-monooxygenase n=1 Tax=Legionella rubrilucens TaxID=458 RepID=A0A0W0XX81_9GAMM|nr:FAD-dependent monooxygenase [Legionella rubrilucens]KTD48948.1 6-hydroxynicotinate 3-monooxygenase precursor [Legionella rubrilucens]
MKKGIIIGGSISGCAVAILLSRLGIEVTVLERSSGSAEGNGAGIMLPLALVKKCIELDLFDADIPRLAISGRTFFRKTNAEGQVEKFWHQSLQGFALNWIDVYRNLRKRLNPGLIQHHQQVINIQKEKSRYSLKTALNTAYTADFVVAADGVESTVRKKLSSTTETYAGYIAWRGTLADCTYDPGESIECYPWENGHILVYRIPAADYEKTGKAMINWLIYERTSPDQLQLRLTDCQNKVHTRSVPPKGLHETQCDYLHALAKAHFPSVIAEIVHQTTHPFIQVIFDSQITAYPDNDLLFVGDAAATARPHSASGVTKALGNAIDLHQLLLSNPDKDLFPLFSQWKDKQQKTNAEEVDKAKKMGDALISNPPDWSGMDQKSMDVWWTQIMLGHTWLLHKPRTNLLIAAVKNTHFAPNCSR